MDEDNDPHSEDFYFRAGIVVSIGIGILVALFLWGLGNLYN